MSLIAWGGVGKSALVKHWLGHMARDKFRGAARVYGWSFFSQGAREGEASADEFFSEALRWFGEPHPEKFQQTERARRLAELIQAGRALLILDGLEPLQHPTGPQEGQLKDQTLAELLRLLAWQNSGLVVITTRLLVDDIRDLRATTAPVIELGHLSPQAGAQLLQVLGVKGEQEELEDASREFGGHGLALNLLGTYLRDILDGDVRRRGEVRLLEEDAEHGGQARRIMRSYEKQFGSSPELAVLHLVGLFDRPARRELIRVLRRPPVIEGLNDELVGQSDLRWKRTLTRLRSAKLLTETSPSELDAHPLVREYFGTRLKTDRSEAWRAGHGRLYQYLRDTTKEYPDTLAEMAPLFQAMYHGCQAKRYQDALIEVHGLRIRRGEHYQLKSLGAYSADLAAISGLFEEPWRQVRASLSEKAQSWLLNQSASDLRALGRLLEAVEPLRAALECQVRQEFWRGAADCAYNLSFLQLALGNIPEAVAVGEAGVVHADRSQLVVTRVHSRATLADALHQAGEPARSQELFEEAEALQAKERLHEPYLYSFAGYWYCDLLLALGRTGELRKRAASAIEVAEQENWLLEKALGDLSLGRGAMALGGLDAARKHLDNAVNQLREAGHIEFVAWGLFARAALFWEIKRHDLAKGDLEEVMRIAKRSEMRLFECDAHLEYARLALVEGDKDQAREHVTATRRLVDETGYGRRRPEVEALEAEVR